MTMDDGADLVSTIHKSRRELLDEIIGGTEETTTGVIRLAAMAADNMLQVPGHRGQRRHDQALLR
jgi:adenosylhomocysteinase